MSLTPAEQMDVGAMRHRIRIQRNAGQRSDSGQQNVDWQDVATVWASIESLSGRELYAAAEVYPEGAARIVIRYLESIDASMRIVWTDPRIDQDRQFDISHIDDVMNRHYMLNITAVERPIERSA